MATPVSIESAQQAAPSAGEGAGGVGARQTSRAALLKRLADVISLPSSRVNAFEKSVTGDLMIEILQTADPEVRVRVARRLAPVSDIPPVIARLLLRDDIETAGPLLAECAALSDAQLLDCARHASAAHRRLIATRRTVGDLLCEALIDAGDIEVIEALLANPGAKLSHGAIEVLVSLSRSVRRLVPALLRRAELRPNHAYALFWWADAPSRRTILQRFAVSREVLQEAASDVFPMAAEEGWTDPISSKALQFIERRQRDRGAIERSAFGSLEEAIEAAERGMTPDLAREIAKLAGVRPMTAARILADEGGEPMAILAKSTGLAKGALASLWRAMRRPDVEPDGQLSPDFERVATTFDMIAVERAQTVLRYWNWSLGAAMSPALTEAVDDRVADESANPARAAMVAQGPDIAA
ncbi:MAG TPA: DUF2336 domain-containing protein [Caulobacteraceae bacterium]|nr:DUF2336 domain-containing protein [Caulobacteraceae bacterium]